MGDGEAWARSPPPPRTLTAVSASPASPFGFAAEDALDELKESLLKERATLEKYTRLLEARSGLTCYHITSLLTAAG